MDSITCCTLSISLYLEQPFHLYCLQQPFHPSLRVRFILEPGSHRCSGHDPISSTILLFPAKPAPNPGLPVSQRHDPISDNNLSAFISYNNLSVPVSPTAPAPSPCFPG